MAQAREKGGRVVFIGNIPYGVSEEQICELFGQIGSVLSFRLVYDKETGKPKGFGFLEYADVDQAAAAVRNLNGKEIMGRQLKVDYSNDNGGGGNRQQNDQSQNNRGPAPPGMFDPANAAQQMQMGGAPSELPPLPQGVDVPPGLSAPDAISKTLQAIPAPQLVDILSQMKNLVATDPAKATALLTQAPQLSYAIFQALLLLGLVDTAVLGQLIQQSQQQQQMQQPQAPQLPPMPPYQQQQPPPHVPPHQQQPQYAAGQPAYPPPLYPPQQQQQQPPQQAGYAATPPVPKPAYQPPAPAPPPPAAVQDPNQAALIQQVLQMTREQIYALDEQPRNQILALRAQLHAPVS